MLTTLPPSCTVSNEIWDPQPPEPSGPVQACTRTALAFSFVDKELQLKFVGDERIDFPLSAYRLLPSTPKTRDDWEGTRGRTLERKGGGISIHVPPIIFIST